MRIWISLALVLAFASTAFAGRVELNRDISSRGLVDNLLDVVSADDTTWGHPFTFAEYTEARRTPVGGTWCPVFDDGDPSFLRYIALSDSIYQGLGAYSALAGVRLRGTTGLIFSNVGVSGNTMTVADLATFAYRQDLFEIAGHGDDSQRLGKEGMDGQGTPARVSFDGETGMSYDFCVKVISACQDSMDAWGFPWCRSWTYGNWRMMNAGQPDIFEEYGFFQAKGLAVVVTADQSSAGGNFLNAMQVNNDPLPPAMMNKTLNRWFGHHRTGLMWNPYDIGSRSSWDVDNGGTPGNDNDGTAGFAGATTDSMKAYIDLCAQTYSHGLVTFHRIVDDGARTLNIDIEYDELVDICVHAATRIKEGRLRACLTFEQHAACMRGIRDGNLFPNQGFPLLTDGLATTLRTGASGVIVEPIGFPGSADFYPGTTDEFVAQGGTNTNWKVYDNTVDTLSVSHNLRDGDTDELTYGIGAPDQNILLTRGTTSNTNNICFPLIVTGVEARYVQLVVQCGILTSTLPSGVDGHMSIKAVQFGEKWPDFINGSNLAYESMADIVGRRNNDANWLETSWHQERQRVYPRGNTALSDTTSTTSPYLSTSLDGVTGNEAWSFWGQLPQLQPYIIHPRTAAWDIQSTVGNQVSVSVAGQAAQSVETNLDLLETQSTPTEFVYLIELDEQTDIVYVVLGMERFTSYTTAVDMYVNAIDAYPIR